MIDKQLVEVAAFKLLQARRAVAFTGAGISVESGIPPFRGPGGLWVKYDPIFLELRYFLRHPEDAWRVIREIFYDQFAKATPNDAHKVLAQWEAEGLLAGGVITQNIDYLHQTAGSRRVIEFHGSNQFLVCLDCGERVRATLQVFNVFPPVCAVCGSVLKPDFVFFSEGIPPQAYDDAYHETKVADVWVVVGTTGEVMPACGMPIEAKRNGATIIEINIQPSEFTDTISDIFLRCSASDGLLALNETIQQLRAEGLDH